MSYPAGVTLVRAPWRNADPPPAPPPPPRCSRLEHVGSSSCTLVQEVFDDVPAPDPHYTDRDLAREREASRLIEAARDSILRPDFSR